MADYTLTADARAFVLAGQDAGGVILAAQITVLPIVVVQKPIPTAQLTGLPLVVVQRPFPTAKIDQLPIIVVRKSVSLAQIDQLPIIVVRQRRVGRRSFIPAMIGA